MLEETGLIVPIGEWVLSTACSRFSQWRANGYDIPRISVNVSPRQLANQNFVPMIYQSISDANIVHSQLEIEITESTLMEEDKSNISAIQDLYTSGISIAMDDFGTGYSSLNYLRQFPIQTLKIDKST